MRQEMKKPEGFFPIQHRAAQKQTKMVFPLFIRASLNQQAVRMLTRSNHVKIPRKLSKHSQASDHAQPAQTWGIRVRGRVNRGQRVTRGQDRMALT